MAIDKAIYVPIFSEASVSTDSPFFTIFPGDIALIQAFGFMDYKTRTDSSELQVPQAACLHMLLFQEGVIKLPRAYGGGVFVADLNQYRTLLLAEETVYLNGCAFMLSKCNNTMLLNIPGSYRFVMNDTTAVGTARIYLRTFTQEEFPWDSKFFIGA